MRKKITVIVPAYNEEDLIAGCLDSLLNQSLDSSQYEVIVVDNNSTDLTARIALSKGVKVEREPRKGYVHAIRRGIEASQSELIAFTDADCRVPPDWLEKILVNFESSKKVVGVGGKLAFYDIPPIVDKTVRSILYLNEALPGNNMAVRREALYQIGGVDPRINLTVDYWLTLKLRKVGKLKVDRRLVVNTSGRRFKNGFDSDIKYFINVMSMQVSSKPVFYDFPDIRD
ncbi:MAG TPA: glycosyltransferase family 2 protein [Anaerolineales bacterium]|nr:glycosyltransferase family 2 protein [Anaerolineales bacterium]